MANSMMVSPAIRQAATIIMNKRLPRQAGTNETELDQGYLSRLGPMSEVNGKTANRLAEERKQRLGIVYTNKKG